MTAPPLAGIVVPIPTLFDERGRVDEEANARHIDWLIGRGVHGIFALGTTGEFTSLSREERHAFAGLAVRAARGRVPVLVGIGSPWTDEAIAYARQAEEAGADGVVSVLPYYWLPSERSIHEHYRLLAMGTALPVYIYNFPALTGRSITPALVARLAAEHRNIAGLKDTIDSAAHIVETIALVKRTRPEFSVLAGMDYHLLNTLLSGGDGCVPGSANYWPDPFVQIYADVRAGRLEAAAERHRASAPVRRLYTADAPPFVVVKEAMAAVGLSRHATVRPPALAFTDEERRAMRSDLAAIGVTA
ncbi:MAG TPA: dihydrodipicolinate synthase family protein [bacterium]|nr:dihydrodipicolinate synthase family protein [bacterium]